LHAIRLGIASLERAIVRAKARVRVEEKVAIRTRAIAKAKTGLRVKTIAEAEEKMKVELRARPNIRAF
jgi:hypothetical protein